MEFERKLDKDQKLILKDLIKKYDDEHFGYSQILPANTGAGKTLITLKLIQHFAKTKPDLQPFVLCPKLLIPMWEKELAQLDIRPLFITTYNRLAGRQRSGCLHPFLIRTDDGFKITKEWPKNAFIICDESQSIKSKKSAAHLAAFTLISHNKNGKVLHLSASPIDKKENWVALYRNLGIMTKKNVMTYENKVYYYTNLGLGEVFNIVKTHAPEIYKRVNEKYDVRTKNLTYILSYLWRRFFIHKYVVKVVDPIYKNIDGVVYNKTLKNYFATLDPIGLALLNSEVKKLVDDSDGDLEDYIRHNVGQVQAFLMRLCESKLNTLIRLTKYKINNGRKVVICCPYVKSQDVLMAKLSQFKPLLLNGKCRNRTEIVDLFNHPNNEYQCIIISNDLGLGIDLHDTHGGFPRTMYMIPTYKFLSMCQCPGRIYRRGLKSDTECYVLYSNDGLIENILINILAKTYIASSVLLPGSGRVYPGHYPYEIEDDDGVKYEKLKEHLEKESNI